MEQLALEPGWLFGWDHDMGFFFAGDTQVCFHCHHYNLFLLRTATEALGSIDAFELVADASQAGWYPLLEHLRGAHPGATPEQLLELFGRVFAAMGHGTFAPLSLTRDGGEAQAVTTHFSMGHRLSHEEESFEPVDAMAAGFLAAATDAAFGLTCGTIQGTQQDCMACGDEVSTFRVERMEHQLPYAYERASLPTTFDPSTLGAFDADAQDLAMRFRAMLAGVSSDDRGLIDAFGILVTVTPTQFYNHLSFEMLRRLDGEHPRLREVAQRMLYEAGRLCGFNTFGGVLRSPEWEALRGEARSSDPERTLVEACAIARSFGFGRWSLVEHVVGQMGVTRAPATYEDAWVHEGLGDEGVDYLYTGASEAMLRLAEDHDWGEDEAFGLGLYERVVRGDDEAWSARQTQCPSRGDRQAEVVVRRWG